MGLADRIRAKAHAALERVPGVVGDKLRSANEALGRPLANEDELSDRPRVRVRAVSRRNQSAPPRRSQQPAAAPVIVYYMDKQKRDVRR